MTYSTQVQASAQISGMNVSLYDLGLRNQTTDEMMIRPNLTSQEILQKYIPWLKRQNTRQEHIYIRPAASLTEHNLILLDDLNPITLSQLLRQYSPNALVETSPSNFQVWLKFNLNMLPVTRTALGRDLAQQFDCDTNAANHLQFGRLAGFTNCKQKYQKANGYYPFTTLIATNGRIHELPTQFIIPTSSTPNPIPSKDVVKPNTKIINKVNNPASIYTLLSAKISTTDQSIADYAVACEAVKLGYSNEQIEVILRAGSDLDARRPGFVDDYIERTVNAAQTKILADGLPDCPIDSSVENQYD